MWIADRSGRLALINPANDVAIGPWWSAAPRNAAA